MPTIEVNPHTEIEVSEKELDHMYWPPDPDNLASTHMCVWEWCLENGDTSWVGPLRQAIGTIETRCAVVHLANFIHVGWALADYHGHFGFKTFDWDFVPWFMTTCVSVIDGTTVSVKDDWADICRAGPDAKPNPTANNPKSWLETVWDALHGYREDCIPEGDEAYDAEWDDICTAMAWITEELEKGND